MVRPGSVQTTLFVGTQSIQRTDPDYDALTVANYDVLREGGIELIPRRGVVEGLRGVKEPEELDAVRRATDVTLLGGRCLSYGEGITYWPLREIVRQAPPGALRDAVLGRPWIPPDPTPA